MPKSLLSSFSNDFNRTIEVHSLTQSKNEIGEVTETWEKTDD
jgi:hypothetical protein